MNFRSIEEGILGVILMRESASPVVSEKTGVSGFAFWGVVLEEVGSLKAYGPDDSFHLGELSLN